MRALVYQGPYDVTVKDVADARIEDPKDAIVRITTTNICGSDLHMYEGRTDVEEGKVLGHENMGVVESVGDAVERIKVGDRVSLPFNIACGTCGNCFKGLTGFCLRANPGSAGAAYGYASMGPYNGGQAEYLRVPWADFNALVLPEGADHELDYTMLSDIFPTGWHGVELAKMQPGETIVVYGAGPVGLMAAHAAKIKGASRVFVVDQQPDRLKLAEQLGAIPVDRSMRRRRRAAHRPHRRRRGPRRRRGRLPGPRRRRHRAAGDRAQRAGRRGEADRWHRRRRRLRAAGPGRRG